MFIPRTIRVLFFLSLFGLLFPAGCARLNPWKGFSGEKRSAKKREKTRYRVGTVRDYAVPAGLHLASIDGFGLVYNLRGTGAPEPPGQQRDYILRELQKKNIDRPHLLLDSKNTAVVRVRGIIPPGIQQGDRFDVKVLVPGEREIKSLQGGILMPVSLREMGLFGGGQIKEGFVQGEAQGPILLNPSIDGKTNPLGLVSGKILGGGIAKKDRPLYLLLKEEHVSAYNAKEIADRINERFYVKEGSKPRGVATAKTDVKIDLLVHPTYRDNIPRYMEILLSIACYESREHRTKRMEELEKKLQVNTTAQDAAFQLEAIGKTGADLLRKGLANPDLEIRFYCAESLAFLNDASAAKPLAEIARTEQAFRARALAALGTMQNDFEAENELRQLLAENSAETRYGAFRALWFRNPNDLAIRGEELGSQDAFRFHYHVLNAGGPPMVHITTSKRPEVVLFNNDIALGPDFILDAGISIMVRSTGPNEVVITRPNPHGMTDDRRTVSARLDDVIRGIVDVGGTYPDVVEFLQEASRMKVLPCRLEIDKLPHGGEYLRKNYDEEAEEEDESATDSKKEKKSFWSRMNPNSWIDEENEKERKKEEELF